MRAQVAKRREETPVGVGDGQFVEHPRGAQVKGGVASAHGRVGQRTGDKCLARPGRPDNSQVVVRFYPICPGQAEHHRAVQAPLAAEVDVFDHRGGPAAWPPSGNGRPGGPRVR